MANGNTNFSMRNEVRGMLMRAHNFLVISYVSFHVYERFLSKKERGVGFILVTQYSTSIPSEARNLGTYFILAAMSEREVQRLPLRQM